MHEDRLGSRRAVWMRDALDALRTWRPLKASSRKGQALCREDVSFRAWKLAWNRCSILHQTPADAHLFHAATSDGGDASALAAARLCMPGVPALVVQANIRTHGSHLNDVQVRSPLKHAGQ